LVEGVEEEDWEAWAVDAVLLADVGCRPCGGTGWRGLRLAKDAGGSRCPSLDERQDVLSRSNCQGEQ